MEFPEKQTISPTRALFIQLNIPELSLKVPEIRTGNHLTENSGNSTMKLQKQTFPLRNFRKFE